MEYVSGTLELPTRLYDDNQLATPEIFTTVKTANFIKYFVLLTD